MKGRTTPIFWVKQNPKRALIVGSGFVLFFALIQISKSVTYFLGSNATNPKAKPLIARTLARAEFPPRLIGYSTQTLSPQFGQHFDSGLPQVEDGTPGRFHISPTLPEGLFLDPKTGVISGTPKQFNERKTLYTLEAINKKGVSKLQITLNPISAEKPRVKFERTTLVLRIGEPLDIQIESTAGPYQWLQLYPENELPKGIYFDKKTGRLYGQLESTEGFTFDNPTKVYFLRSKGFRTIQESSVHISVLVPENTENQVFKGACLNAEGLIQKFQRSGSHDDALLETWAGIESGDYRIPSPKYLFESESKRNRSLESGNKRFVRRKEWSERSGYEINQTDCQSALIRRHTGEPWTLYMIDSYHSGKAQFADHVSKHRVVFRKKQKDPVMPDRIDFTRITERPSDPKKDIKDYLEMSEWIYDSNLRVTHRCDEEIRHENQRLKVTRTLQLGITPSRKPNKVYAEGGTPQNPAWSNHVKKLAQANPEFSCKFVD